MLKSDVFHVSWYCCMIGNVCLMKNAYCRSSERASDAQGEFKIKHVGKKIFQVGFFKIAHLTKIVKD
jgi:hypothetical protein